MADDCCSKRGDTIAALGRKANQRRVLIIVMLINFAMFCAEFGGGLLARTSALMADSADMLGDAIVYALSFYTLSRGPRWEAGAALAKGGIILVFGVAIIVEIVNKIVDGVPSSSTLMLIFGSAALVANLTCLALLWRFRSENVKMSSTFDCSRNDVASNVGVLMAAGLVAGTGQHGPTSPLARLSLSFSCAPHGAYWPRPSLLGERPRAQVPLPSPPKACSGARSCVALH